MIWFEMQRQSYDCGAAAFAASLALRGLAIDYQKACEVCCTTELGTGDLDLMAAFSYVGMGARGYNAEQPEPGDILCVESGGHWVTYLAKINSMHLVWDPETGAVLMSEWDLENSWGPERYGIRAWAS